MALPDFNSFAEMLARVKRADQSWGNFFSDICSRRLKIEGNSEPLLAEQLARPSLIHLLAKWDFYSSDHLDQASKDYDVKSWQLTEYIESLREKLVIGEADLIVFEQTSSQQDIHIDDSLSSVEASAFVPEVDQSGQELPSKSTYQPAVTQAVLSPSTTTPSKTVLGLTALVSALIVLLVALVAIISGQRNTSPGQLSAAGNSGASTPPSESLGNSQAAPPETSGEEVYFTGIKLPVTNSLCNKKRTFCIYNLARLVEAESGEATYTFSDLANGQQVNISGVITIANIDKSGGGRSFTFAFRDDQGATTPGWAAAGYFNLDQDSDPAKPGILTKFKTTESFGPKTPVGLENTSYLFPS